MSGSSDIQAKEVDQCLKPESEVQPEIKTGRTVAMRRVCESNFQSRRERVRSEGRLSPLGEAMLEQGR